jgi:thiamine pyrophosphokinase
MNKFFTGKNPVVVVGNGEFPTHTIPLNHLKNAGTIICTDGGADQLSPHNFTPDIIVGDMDSTKLKIENFKGLWISSPDQNRTDLQKTLDWCIANDLTEVTVLGIMGKREDHSLGNLHVLAEFSQKMNIQGKKTISSVAGQQISIVAIENIQSISTVGLKYELKNENFLPTCNGISNEAIGEIFIIETTEPIWLFINHLK